MGVLFGVLGLVVLLWVMAGGYRQSAAVALARYQVTQDGAYLTEAYRCTIAGRILAELGLSVAVCGLLAAVVLVVLEG